MVGLCVDFFGSLGVRGPGAGSGLRLRQADNYRDVMIEGDCDNAVRALCDCLGWRDDLGKPFPAVGVTLCAYLLIENMVEALESKNQNSEVIDWSEAFPSMVPGGKSYNWRTSGPLELPEITTVEFMESWSHLETAQLESLDGASEVTLHIVGNSHDSFGDKLEGLLCLRGEAQESWDEDDYIALVAEGSKALVMSSYAAFAYLDTPNSYEQKVKVDIHKFELEVKTLEGHSNSNFELWVCSNERGEVTARFGPFDFAALKNRNNL